MTSDSEKTGGLYPYTQGDLIKAPQTYTYTAYQGLPFLDGWRQVRRTTVEEYPPLKPLAANLDEPCIGISPEFGETILTAGFLESLFAGFQSSCVVDDANITKALGLLKVFENSKHVYAEYVAGFRPLPNASSDNLELYVRTAEVFETAFSRTAKLYFLNGLLKVLDTLCAARPRLNGSECRRLAWLVEKEENHVLDLAKRNHLSL